MLRSVVVFVCLSVVCQTDQTSSLDSLGSAGKATVRPVEYERLIDLAICYGGIDSLSKALVFTFQARALAMQHADTPRIVQSARIAGQIFNRLERNKEAEVILLNVLPVAKQYNLAHDYVLILCNLAVAYTFQAKYDKALQLNFEALSFCQKIHDYKTLAVSLNNIGLIHYKLKNYTDALHYFEASLEHKKQWSSSKGLRITLMNIANCYVFLGQFLKAEQFIMRSLATGEDTTSKDLLMEVEFARGVMRLSSGEPRAAENHFLRSYGLSVELRNDRFQLDNSEYLGEIYMQKGEFTKAVRYLKAAENLIDKDAPFYLEAVKIYKKFSQLYNSTGDRKMVFHYQQKYIDLRENIHNEQVTTNLMKLESEFLERANRAKIQEQEQLLLVNSKILRKQKTLNALLVGTGFLLIGLTVVLWRKGISKQRFNRLLDLVVAHRRNSLERINLQLVHKAAEKSIVILRLKADIKRVLATLDGLRLIATKHEYCYEVAEYLTKIQTSCMLLGRFLENNRARDLGSRTVDSSTK